MSIDRRWDFRESVTAIGVAAVIAGLGGAAIYAATGDASSQFPGPAAMHGPAAGDGPPSGALAAAPRAGGAERGPALHGQVVVADGSGGFVTVMSQSGTVTATAPDSLTVRSADGYTQIWRTSAGQGSEFGVDDSILVRGEQRPDAAAPVVTEVLDPQRTPR